MNCRLLMAGLRLLVTDLEEQGMMRRQAEAGGTKIRVLIIAVLLVSFATYQLLIPIDDPSLDGPDNSGTLSADVTPPR